jgi:AAA domain/Bifunctional DNA primase/polymerase, N-terminal
MNGPGPVMNARECATRYHGAGWHPVPLPAGQKALPPTGRTGYGGSDMTLAEIDAEDWTGNVGLRMPEDVIGLDVDVYHGGDQTLNELLARRGPLPPTWISHSGRNDGSGIRFFRVPIGFVWVTSLAGIEIIQRIHRYAVVYPSIHPDGRAYGWVDLNEARFTTDIPSVEDLPELPWPWIAELSRAQQVDTAHRPQAVNQTDLDAFLEAHNQADQPSYVGNIFAHFTQHWRAGYSRHDTMQHCLIWAMECVRAGIVSGRPTVAQFADLWVEAVSPDTRRAQIHSDHRTTEFEAMLRHAVGKVVAKSQAEIYRIHDDIAGPPMRPGPPPAAEVIVEYQDEEGAGIFLDWAAFANRDPDTRRWLVEWFWPWGRSLALWAAAKTGKSELALWCAAKLALGEHPWTGDPIEPVDVAYFDFEMTEDDLDDRLAHFNIDPTRLGHLHYALLPPLHALDIEKGGKQVEKLVADVGARAVVFDTFGRAVSGEEDKADTVRDFYRHTGSRLKRLGIGYLRTDHAGKDRTKGQRGSSAKRDDVDIVWSMKRNETGIVLDCSGSSRLGWVGPTLVLERTELNGILSYSSAVRLGWPAGTKAKVAELDGLGLPDDVSRRAAREALMTAGLVPGRNEILAAACKFRATRASNGPGTSPSLQANGTPE